MTRFIQLFTFSIVAAITLTLIPSSQTQAQSTDLKLNIQGIECDLDAVAQQYGYIPDFCKNKPTPIEPEVENPIVPLPQKPVPHALVYSSALFLTLPTRGGANTLPKPVTMPTKEITIDTGAPSDTRSNNSASFLLNVIVITALVTAILVDGLIFGTWLRRWFFSTRAL